MNIQVMGVFQPVFRKAVTKIFSLSRYDPVHKQAHLIFRGKGGQSVCNIGNVPGFDLLFHILIPLTWCAYEVMWYFGNPFAVGVGKFIWFETAKFNLCKQR